MQDAFRRLFEQWQGRPPVAESPVTAHGSHRRMVRLRGGDGASAIAVVGPDPDENRAFLSFSRAFRSIGLPVPEVLGVDEATGVYLVEDLGDTTLFSALVAARETRGGAFPPDLLPVYRRVLEWLPRFQVEGGRAVDYAVAHPREAFDRQSMQWDLDYFKYHFLKLAQVPFNEDRLQRDCERIVSWLLEADTSHFLYRDFQSRNVMLRGGEPWFIDYQGGRRGALQYDVASLLYDAKAAVPQAVRDDLLGHYLGALRERLAFDEASWRRHFRGYALVRILQAMGAYGYRGFYERKAHFLQSVPHAVRNLEGLLAEGLAPFDTPELRAVLERVCARDDLRRPPDQGASGLTVRVGSFSYRRGYPADETGHGGGFVFDCRALPNPGLEARFAGLTGRDAPVAAFLDAEPAVAAFLASALALVEAQVAAYVARGYTSLDVHFGCTGGQHRSVHAAERAAAALRARCPQVRVLLVHREQDHGPAPGLPAPPVGEAAGRDPVAGRA